MKGFRDFILRGNLVELAVAFIMATAFAAVVDCDCRPADGRPRQARRHPRLQQLDALAASASAPG